MNDVDWLLLKDAVLPLCHEMIARAEHCDDESVNHPDFTADLSVISTARHILPAMREALQGNMLHFTGRWKKETRIVYVDDMPVHKEMLRGSRERRFQENVMRDIFGNPFHPNAADPAWLRWNDHTILNIARTIYLERRWDAMPILADALEEAGCADTAILTHCREKREHVRGCWMLDLLLGKS